MQELQPTGFESDHIAFFSYFTIALGIKKQKSLVRVSFFYFSQVFHITINSIL